METDKNNLKIDQSGPNPNLEDEVIVQPKTKQVKAKKTSSRKGRWVINFVLIIFLMLLVGGVAAIYFVVIPLQNVTASVNSIQDNAGKLAQDLQNKDIVNLKTYTDSIKSEIDKIDSEIDKYDFLATTDLTRGYYNNFKIAKKILLKTSLLLDKTLPEIEELLLASGFTNSGATSFEVAVPLSSEEATNEDEESAFTLILKKMPEYLELYATLEPEIISILNDLKEIDPNYLPVYGDYNFPEILGRLNNASEEFPEISAKVQDILKQLPKLLGSGSQADYLLVLQNETEMRSSGGLLTAFGHMAFKDGEIVDDIFLKDIEKLENYLVNDLGVLSTKFGYNNIYGQLYLMERGCGAYHLRSQDSGIYPDLNLTMEMLSKYYNEASRFDKVTYPGFNYTLILNLAFAENLIELIQPLSVEGYDNITGENLFDIIKLTSDSNTLGTDRKDIIKTIANAAEQKLLDLPIEKLPVAINLVVQAFQAKDLALNAPNDSDLQAYFDKYGMSGRIDKSFEGDYFHLNEAQNCALKLNKLIRNTVHKDIFISDSGDISKKIKIEWTQPKVFEPGLEKQYSPGLNYSYRAWLRVFAPEGSKNFKSNGFSQSGYLGYYPVTYFDSKMDKAVSDNIIQFDHRRFSESDPVYRDDMEITYDLPQDLNYITNRGYQLLIQKHSGKSWGEKYFITIHDKGEVYPIEFVLDRDKVITYNQGVISVENFDTSLDWIPDLVNKIPLE